MTNTNENAIITIKQLSSELFIQPKSLRKKLRDNNIPKPGTRWEWPEDHETVIRIRSWKDQKVSTPTKEEVKEIPKVEVKEEISQEEVWENLHPVNYARGSELLFTKETAKGIWSIVKEEKGIKATYASEKSNDSTKWINQESDIRPTLPKYIQEEIKKALN